MPIKHGTYCRRLRSTFEYVGTSAMRRRTILAVVGAASSPALALATAKCQRALKRNSLRSRASKAKIFDGDGDIGPFPTDPGNHPASQPYLYFPIIPSDDGNPHAARTAMPGFAGRKPVSVEWKLAQNTAALHIHNGGSTASDLIRVDYEIVYCTLASHQPDQGFAVNHAGESQGSTSEDLLTTDYVLPGRSVILNVKLSPFLGVKNIYIRARVSTLFSPRVDKANWNWATDPKVVEAWTAVV